ncbi:MAG: hypothetical protein ACR2NZ_25155, partial [Rubripirellula sp.]
DLLGSWASIYQNKAPHADEPLPRLDGGVKAGKPMGLSSVTFNGLFPKNAVLLAAFATSGGGYRRFAASRRIRNSRLVS